MKEAIEDKMRAEFARKKHLVDGLNSKPRTLTANQKVAAVILEIFPELQKAPDSSEDELAQRIYNRQVAFAAKLIKVRPYYIDVAVSIQQKDPALLNKVRTGELTISQAEERLDYANEKIALTFDPCDARDRRIFIYLHFVPRERRCETIKKILDAAIQKQMAWE